MTLHTKQWKAHDSRKKYQCNSMNNMTNAHSLVATIIWWTNLFCMPQKVRKKSQMFVVKTEFLRQILRHSVNMGKESLFLIVKTFFFYFSSFFLRCFVRDEKFQQQKICWKCLLGDIKACHCQYHYFIIFLVISFFLWNPIAIFSCEFDIVHCESFVNIQKNIKKNQIIQIMYEFI